MPNTNHPLFQTHALRGTAQISGGEVSLPYHIYDGYGAFIGGTADLAKVQQLLASEEVQPIQNGAGRALMGVWLCDFVEANLGPHHEMQISSFVSRGQVAPISAQRLGLLGAMLSRPDMHMMCHGLWNSTPLVGAYNRELLSLNARLSHSSIMRTEQEMNVAVEDAESGALLLKCKRCKPKQAAIGATFALWGQLGLSHTLEVSRQPPTLF